MTRITPLVRESANQERRRSASRWIERQERDALGRERGHEHDWSREQARQRLQQRQAELQRTQERGIDLEAGHSMEIGL
jgi:VIT1/CCC1 family predicted Fe2+/Mn2+ transporter